MSIKRLLLKRFQCVAVLLLLPLIVEAYYVQLEQISTKEGLNYQEVSTMVKDAHGCLWVGTDIGFNIISNGDITSYSVATINGESHIMGRVNAISCYSNTRSIIASERFMVDYDMSNQSFTKIKYSNQDLVANSIVVIGDFAYFFDLASSAMFKYSFLTREISLVHQFPKEKHFAFDKLLAIADKTDELLMAEDNRGVFKIDLTTGSFENIERVDTNIVSRASMVDSHNILWVALQNDGVKGYYINSGYELIATYSRQNSDLNSDNINCILEQPNGDLCVGTDGSGINYINRETGKIEISRDPLFDVTTALCMIGINDILIGTIYNGLIVVRRGYTHSLNSFSLNEANTMSNNVALSAYDEGNGIIWFGTAGGGVNRYDEEKDETTIYPNTDGLRVTSVRNFDDNKLLIGTIHNGFLLFDKKTGEISDSFLNKFKKLHYDLSKGTNIRIAPDLNGNYLVFNFDGKNFRYNPKTDVIDFFQLCLNEKTDKEEDVDNVVIKQSYAVTASRNTICLLDYETLTPKHVYTTDDDITSFAVDSKEIIWFVDSEGLFKYDPSANKATKELSALLSGAFVTLAVDNSDVIWLSSTDGLVYRYNQHSGDYQVYSREDGIPAGNFLRTFALYSSTGRLYLPNASGLLIIDTNQMTPRKEFQKNVQCVSLKKDGKYIEIPENLSVVLPNNYESFVVELSVGSEDPTVPVDLRLVLDRNYELLSLTETSNTIISNAQLKYGSYRLLAQTMGRTGWSEPQTVMEFKVKRPLLLTIPAIAIMLLLLILIIWQITEFRLKVKQRDIDKLLFEEFSKQKEARISFITNIAHELRTPLSLIINPVKDILLEKAIVGLDYDRIERIYHQINKMTKMVDMILDSSSTSDVSINDRVEQVDLNDWVSKIIEDYKIDCYGKGLEMRFEPSETIDMVNIDKGIVETALSNVLSNAIKYSDSGTITVTIHNIEGFVRISVADQGRSFNCKPEDLFKRFFRENNDVPGYGLGLSYSQMQLGLIGGVITAEKNKDVGSTFHIDIPLTLVADSAFSSYLGNEDNDYSDSSDNASESVFDTKTQTMLFVDDQLDLLDFVKNEYSSLFKTVYVAKNGKEAMDIIVNKLPNVVVSDIMMPGMNGFDLCKSIKSNLEFSHIPVILLTSRTNPKIRLIGCKLGADSFLPKPFDSKVLYKIMRNQLWNRFEIKRQYSKSFFSVISEDQTFSAADEKFVLKLNKYIRDNLSNPDLNVDMVIDHMCVSRTTLFNKMNNLVGTSTNKYIRRLRVEAAKELLDKTDKSVGDIAIELGFSESQYFSSVFKQDTGETPSQYKRRIKPMVEGDSINS